MEYNLKTLQLCQSFIDTDCRNFCFFEILKVFRDDIIKACFLCAFHLQAILQVKKALGS